MKWKLFAFSGCEIEVLKVEYHWKSKKVSGKICKIYPLQVNNDELKLKKSLKNN